jgi:glucose-6-phosphate 1-epimerase
MAKIWFSSTGATVDCVVWNPWVKKAAAMGDFGDEEYHTMCCVEPGYVSKPYELEPTKVFALVVKSQLVQPSL